MAGIVGSMSRAPRAFALKLGAWKETAMPRGVLKHPETSASGRAAGAREPRLRRAAPEDAADLETFVVASAVAAYGAACGEGWAEGLARKGLDLGVLGAADHGWWVLESEGRLLGFSEWRATPAPGWVAAERPLELGRLYLREEAKGRGLGDRLMAHGLAQAGAAGHDALWLLVWGLNARAIRFYRAWGFRAEAQLAFRTERGPTPILGMVKRLAPRLSGP